MESRRLVFDDAAGKRNEHSMRQYDDNGFMRVADCPLTKEQVAEYLGREVPGWERLGLKPERIYRVYRPASELSKPETLASVRNIFLLLDHAPVTPDDVQSERIIGNVGEKVRWDGKYLRCNLNIIARKAQDRIKDESMRELSLSYAYTPVMSPGKFNGQHYDIVMRDIRANHLALVEAGRAGSDVRVNDALPKELTRMDKNEILIQALQQVLNTLAPNQSGATGMPGAGDSDEAQDNDELEKEQDLSIEEKDDMGTDPEAPEGADTEDSDEASDSDEEGADDEDAVDDEDAEDSDEEGAEDEDAVDDEDAEDSDQAEDEEGDQLANLLKAIGAEVNEENIAALKSLAAGKTGDSDLQAQDSARMLRRSKTRRLANDSRRIEAVRQAAIREGAVKAAIEVKREFKRRHQAAEEVAPFIGKVDIFAFDSAAAIYREAAVAVGLDARLARDPKVVRGYLLSQRNTLGMGGSRLANDSRRRDSGVDAVLKMIENV